MIIKKSTATNMALAAIPGRLLNDKLVFCVFNCASFMQGLQGWISWG